MDTLAEAQDRARDAAALAGRRLAYAVDRCDLAAVESATTALAVTLLDTADVVSTHIAKELTEGGGSLGLLSSTCGGSRRETRSGSHNSLVDAFASLVSSPADSPTAHAPTQPGAGASPSAVVAASGVAPTVLAGVLRDLNDVPQRMTASLNEFVRAELEAFSEPEQARCAALSLCRSGLGTTCLRAPRLRASADACNTAQLLRRQAARFKLPRRPGQSKSAGASPRKDDDSTPPPSPGLAARPEPKSGG